MKKFNHAFVTLPKMKRIEVEGKRFYVTPSGNRYQSVTTMTSNWNKKAIQEWKDRIGEEKANEISTRAAQRGTSMHKLCEQYLRNEVHMTQMGLPLFEEQNPLSLMMFKKIIPCMEDIDNIRVVEGTLYSDELELAGTTDCIADYEGELSVIDFKTSTYPKKKEYIKNYFMQCAAYGRMYEELYGITPSKIVIIMSVETTSYPIVFTESYSQSFDMLKEFMLDLSKKKV